MALVSAVLTYQKPGTQPPIYVAGTWTEPPWEPLEMDYTTAADGKLSFKKEIQAIDGTSIQYKFRIGRGDWWVLDENAPTILDGMGNENNTIQIQRRSTNPQNSITRTEAFVKSSSEKNTPGSAQVAAEVAESAALLDRSDSSPRPESRETSTTPMNEFASTAAAVADTAMELDDESPLYSEDSPPLLPHEQHKSFVVARNEDDSDGPPSFAYEHAGLYESEKRSSESSRQGSRNCLFNDNYHNEQVDLNDPTLEVFPSGKSDVLKTVRRLETGLSQDRTSFDCQPPSPIVSRGRRRSSDLSQLIHDSPSLSPTSPRPGRRLDIPKESRASLDSRSSSLVSLDSIVEDQSEDLRLPNASISPSRGCLKGSPTSAGPSSIAAEEEARKPETELRSAQDVENSHSPEIVVHEAGSSSSPDDSEVMTVGLPDSGHLGSVRSRTGLSSSERSATPNSIHSTGMEAVKGGGWFRAFYRLLFVDIIGGILAKLFGKRQET